MKLLIIFDPAEYKPGEYDSSSSITPFLVPDDLDTDYEFLRMLDQYEPNHCIERFESFLRDKCNAVDIDIDIFNYDKGCLEKRI